MCTLSILGARDALVVATLGTERVHSQGELRYFKVALPENLDDPWEARTPGLH